jgi:hypothetical protein
MTEMPSEIGSFFLIVFLYFFIFLILNFGVKIDIKDISVDNQQVNEIKSNIKRHHYDI